MKLTKRPNQVAITLPPNIIEKADKDAKKENRKRTNVLANIIIKHYENRGDSNE